MYVCIYIYTHVLKMFLRTYVYTFRHTHNILPCRNHHVESSDFFVQGTSKVIGPMN